jgi:hypothetical protein
MVSGGANENRQHLRRQHPDQAETVTAVDVSNSCNSCQDGVASVGFLGSKPLKLYI